MIKTRLVGLLSHAKKYIVYTILWQWAALLSQVVAVFSIADLLERVVYRTVTVPVIERTVFTGILVIILRFICERMGTRASYLACVDVKRILREKIYENLQGLTTLKIYQADQLKADEMDEESQNFRKITMKVLTMQLNSTSVMDIVAYGGAAIGMAVAVSEFLKGNISLSGTLCIVLLASEFFLPLRLLGSFFHIAMNGMAASDKIFRILDLPEPKTGEKTLPEGALDISLKEVHFSYEADREILKGISLNLPAGS